MKLKSYNRIPCLPVRLAAYLVVLEALAFLLAKYFYPYAVLLVFDAFGHVFELFGVTTSSLPRVSETHALLALLSIPASAFLALSDVRRFHNGAWLGERPSRSSVHGSARLISSPGELRRSFVSWKKDDEQEVPMLVIGGIGSKKDELLCADIKHALILGSTGAGKTVSALLPTLVQNILSGSTVIALDPKRELFDVCAAFAESHRYRVHLVDFASPTTSDTWNPLASAIQSYREEAGSGRDAYFSEIRELASILIPEGGAESNPIWTRAARMLFCAASAYAVTSDDMPDECRNLSTVAWLLAQAQEHLSEIAEALPRESEVRRAIESSANAPKETYGSYRINALAWLDDYADPLMSRMLAKSEFSTKDLADGKHIVFVSFNSGSSAYDALVAAFVAQTMAGLRRHAQLLGGKLPNEVFWLLEEFGQLPKLPNLIKDSAIIRSMGMHLVLAIQDRSQLKTKYGADASTLLNNLDTTLFLSSSDYETLRHYSDLLGNCTVETVSQSQTKGSNSGSTGKTVSYSESKLIRPEELGRWDWRVGHLIIDRGVPYACSSTPVNACFAGDSLGLEGELPEKARLRLMPERPDRNPDPAPVWTGSLGSGGEPALVAIASLASDPRFS